MTTPAPPGSALAAARERIAGVQSRLAAAAARLRPPPPEPTTCCGRGCNGCVWEGYFDALAFWLDDAAALLQTPASSGSTRASSPSS